jgi:hypothetical protein
VSAFISCTCECHVWDMYVLAFNLNCVPHFLTFTFYSQSWESVGCIRLTQDGWSVLLFCEHCNKRHRICWLAKWCQGLCFCRSLVHTVNNLTYIIFCSNVILAL